MQMTLHGRKHCLRRSEPSSRTAFMGEQPNPWNRLQLQVAMHVVP